jgi:hypothetical protein
MCLRHPDTIAIDVPQVLSLERTDLDPHLAHPLTGASGHVLERRRGLKEDTLEIIGNPTDLACVPGLTMIWDPGVTMVSSG